MKKDDNNYFLIENNLQACSRINCNENFTCKLGCNSIDSHYNCSLRRK